MQRMVSDLDNTITEHDMDPAAQQYVQQLRGESSDAEPDLAVDGLSESILRRLIRMLTFNLI